MCPLGGFKNGKSSASRATIGERLLTKGTSINQGGDTVAAWTIAALTANSMRCFQCKPKGDANRGTALAAGERVCKGQIYCNEF